MIVRTIVHTLAGCVGCQAGVELLNRQVKNSLNLLTLTTCIFVSLEGLFYYWKSNTVKQSIPTRYEICFRSFRVCLLYYYVIFMKLFSVYIKIVVLFFFVNLCNNYAIRCDVYFPLFIIFKSGSLLANIVFGYMLRGHYYTSREVFSVIIVTGGIIIFTLASYEKRTSMTTEPLNNAFILSIPPFFVGVSLLSIALVLSAYLGVCQEDMYRIYGKHVKESMFMVHFLSIPGFALIGNDIIEAFQAANKTPSLHMFGYDLVLPTAWCCIFGICILQYICINNVYRLTSLTSSLNVTMVISLRKFLSLLISFVVFDNTFNIFHFCGAVFVFIGSLMFSKVL
ncbi:UAA transporter family protein [Dictyocaulus viviparus]|uniref:UAA transporter family protein n=1 Tax=Dictyocaulus viviparus TaxID=29172 RepID=A0A0D8XK94_DICVI|nr:UAA transporter family protein [Dictyocaulus viviparus]